MLNKGRSPATAAANQEAERPQFSTNTNGCHYSLMTVIVNHLQQLFFENPAELTTLNDVSPADFP